MMKQRKFQLASDVHLHGRHRDHELYPLGDKLLLAGDIVQWPDAVETQVGMMFFERVCASYEHVYYIMGNHEFYDGDFNRTLDELRSWKKPANLTFLHGDTVELDDDLVLFGHPMWTDFDKGDWFAMKHAERRMNDFYLCTHNYGASPWTPYQTVLRHEEGLRLLSEAYEKYSDRNFLVMTHHAPSVQSVEERYRTEPQLNHAYYSNLEKFMLDRPRIKHWVHGHMHSPADYMVGNCRVMCNPLGYHHVYNNFNPSFVFEA